MEFTLIFLTFAHFIFNKVYVHADSPLKLIGTPVCGSSLEAHFEIQRSLSQNKQKTFFFSLIFGFQMSESSAFIYGSNIVKLLTPCELLYHLGSRLKCSLEQNEPKNISKRSYKERIKIPNIPKSTKTIFHTILLTSDLGISELPSGSNIYVSIMQYQNWPLLCKAGYKSINLHLMKSSSHTHSMSFL